MPTFFSTLRFIADDTIFIILLYIQSIFIDRLLPFQFILLIVILPIL